MLLDRPKRESLFTGSGWFRALVLILRGKGKVRVIRAREFATQVISVSPMVTKDEKMLEQIAAPSAERIVVHKDLISWLRR
jgi:hypothetical protein